MAVSEYIGTSNFQPAVSKFEQELTVLQEKVEHKIDIGDLVQNWDTYALAAELYKKHEKEKELQVRQAINKKYREMIKHIHWSGNCCIIYWSDGTQTKSFWDKDEFFDPEKAILAAMARKLFGGTGIYNEVIRKYEKAGWDYYYDNLSMDVIDDLDFNYEW